MAEYLLTASESVIRTADSASIPNDPANRDWVEYQKWLADGGVPDPYVPPEPVAPTPTSEQATLYDHENRLRKIEGLAPMKLGDFIAKMQ
jgi:hypothetical protein